MKTEQNNTEKYFKDKLKDRTIEPSPMAWDRLDAMLTVAEQGKKRQSKRAWLYLAAGFAVFFTLGILLMQEEQKQYPGVITDEKIVITNETEQKVIDVPENTGIVYAEDDAPFTNTVSENNIDISTVANTSNVKIRTEKPIITTEKSYTASVDNNKNNIQATTDVYYVMTDKQSEKQENINKTVSKSKITVDAALLLASVESETENEIAVSVKTNETKINPNSLLSSVESDVDNSFRSRILQKAVENYKAVKTYVVNRNYE